MWAYESVFYQIYPLGFCGAPFENDGVQESRILKVIDWIPHMQKLGINAIYFSPVFESDTHGYNTRDYSKIDCRLGTNEDFKKVCSALHDAGIKVVLDGVFNHVGRGFWAFQDVLKNRENSRYKDWFARIAFDGNSNYNDGLWYEGWEGNYDLVKLNLRNEEVIQHLLNSVQGWVDEFDIDGLRLDVCYCLDQDFLRRLRGFTNQLKPEFLLLGELLHGDYNQFVNDEMCHSATNYECYKGLFSSFNSMNMFEIVHSLLRQFGPENWTLYRGKHMLSFVDNHDVTRIASNLTNEKHLPLIYAMAFGMPGIPCVYYGSEWGAKAHKNEGDPALRACFDAPIENELSQWIGKLAEAKKNSKALNYGSFKSIVLTNKQCIFEREWEGERVLVAVNADENPFTAHFDARAGRAVDLITGEDHDFGGGSELPPYSAYFWKTEC
ncbi:MAG: alpha-glucosidase C-terminal domain-containing protein [Lachnospiraceae bacterium]|nr:alpha-glucosidase C-terminal domain-containing protein [Lachnospiraceae bacterium]